MKQFIIILLGMTIILSCNTTKKTSFEPDYKPGPSTIVYKTTKDYSQNVPVILNDEKTKIVSYYGTGDLTYQGKLAFPTQLEDGYLLDNIGIKGNVAYTSLKIEAYSKSMKAWTIKELFELIIDDDPIKEMYNCGNRNGFTDDVKEINEIIKNKQLKDCKKLK